MIRIRIIFAFLFIISVAASATTQEHRHPVADIAIHESFYRNWMMPDDPRKSCCSSADCYPTTIKYEGAQLFARRREDGAWLPVPPSKIERHRDNPDGRNHLCAPSPAAISYPPLTVFCFTLGFAI